MISSALMRAQWAPSRWRTSGFAQERSRDKNTGDGTLVLSSFADTLEPGVVVPADCATLSVGETCSFGYSHDVTEAEGEAGSLENTATAVYGLSPGYDLPNTMERSDNHTALIRYRVLLPLILRR